MKFIIFYLSVSLGSIIIFYMGETISDRFPNNRISKWWRKNVVVEDPFDK